MSTTEKCPNCEGFCCRADSGITVEHRVNKHTRHVCPDCNDGTVSEPCPTCDGWCCRGLPGMSAMHLSVRNAKHVCPDCEDGTEPSPRPVRTAEDERADVLAYLAYARTFPFPHPSNTAGVLDALRDLVVQGMHEGWSKK